MTFSGHPGLIALVFWPIIGAVFSYIIGRKSKRLRDYFSNFVVLTTFAGMIGMAFLASNQTPPYFEWSGFMGFRLYFRLDGLRAIYGVVAAFMWVMTTLFSREYFAHYRNRNRYYFFTLLTFGATLGVFFSADLITTFLFFEVMSFTSYVLVIHDERPATLDAARTYMAVAVIGGLAMLFGIFILHVQLGTTEIAALLEAVQQFQGNMGILYLAGTFLLIGFGGKAGMFPLHIWLPNAHPVAPAPASALLSGILTKTGVFGIIIIGSILFHQQAGWGYLMINIGIVGMLTGAVLALFSTDLKRTLAYSSISQIGFIILGVGMQSLLYEYYNSMPIQGTLLHMLNHSLIKLLLFMAAGVVVMNTHQLDLNKIRGFGRGKPLFSFCFLMGVLTIIGMPFWSGYVSKTLLHESLVYHIWLFQEYSLLSGYFQVLESLFTLVGGLTTAYMIKLFVCICLEKNQFNQKKLTKLNKRYMNKVTATVLFLCAIILPILGALPYAFMVPIGTFGQTFMQRFSPPYEINFLAWINLRGALASLLIGGILYTFIVRVCLMSKDAEGRSVYIDLWPKSLNIEMRIYRPLLLQILPFIGAFFARIVSSVLPALLARFYQGFVSFRAFWIRENSQPKSLDVIHSAQNRNERFLGDMRHAADHAKGLRTGFQSDLTFVSYLAHILNMRFSGEFMRIIFGSLAYSLLIFFVGFAIVQIIVFTR